MTSLLANLLPLSIASAIGPGQILFDTLLLRSPDRGAVKAGFFVGGMTVVRLLQGIVFGLIFSGATAATSASGQPGTITSTLPLVLLVLGILLAHPEQPHSDDWCFPGVRGILLDEGH